ncbi:rRNA methyltransferase [Slackia equolifaciens]|uniref:rRNA methyltransferase n=1 Tax=Slackia equolifaciens TaxID=498718 RepID=A0A3N0B0U4_9ACTN|nr:RNA methyltransferase [Slackia equolifaciens]RNL40480.1 rRNA methyltransferase [Slackia equolifaciens]
MPYIHIDSLDDPRLDAYARLTEAQLRNKLEPEKGIFIAESIKVIERALEGGMVPVSVLMTPHWLDAAADVVTRIEAAGVAAKANERTGAAAGFGSIEESDEAKVAGNAEVTRTAEGAGDAEGTCAADDGVPIFVAPEDELKKLTGFALTRGILCAMRRPQLPSAEELIDQIAREKSAAMGCVPEDVRLRVAVLEGIVDHTNVGAIFRSAAALGVDVVLVTPTCCDPLYRRAVRVSMGTVFQVPWTRIGENVHEWPAAGLERLHALGFKTAAMALSDDSIPLGASQLAACNRLALVFGTEGDGLAQQTIAGCDYTVRIPMKHHVDSLNVAAASAVAFWELCGCEEIVSI